MSASRFTPTTGRVDALAAEIVEWHDREWFDRRTGLPKTAEQVALKLAEESGEIAGAVVRIAEGRTDDDWLAAARSEIGDTLVVLSALAARLAAADVEGRSWSLDDLRTERWASVRHRRSAAYRSPDGTFDAAACCAQVAAAGLDGTDRVLSGVVPAGLPGAALAARALALLDDATLVAAAGSPPHPAFANSALRAVLAELPGAVTAADVTAAVAQEMARRGLALPAAAPAALEARPGAGRVSPFETPGV